MGSIVGAVRSPRRVAVLVAVALLCAAAAASADRGSVAGGASSEVIVERGDRGPAVRRIQRALALPADGVFGSQTERAVRQFQRRSGLIVDGVVGPQTRQGLGLAAFSRSSVRSSGVRVPGILQRIAECESGGNPSAVSADGRYRGKYQFSRATWRDMGGSGDPAAAPESVQDAMAAKLLAQRGTSPWPVCG